MSPTKTGWTGKTPILREALFKLPGKYVSQKDACPTITDPTCGVSSSDFQPAMFTKQLIWDDVHKLFCNFPPKQDLACFRLHQTPLESKKLSTLITP